MTYPSRVLDLAPRRQRDGAPRCQEWRKGSCRLPPEVGHGIATWPRAGGNTDNRNRASRSHHPDTSWRTGGGGPWPGGRWNGGLPRRGLRSKSAGETETPIPQHNALSSGGVWFFGRRPRSSYCRNCKVVLERDTKPNYDLTLSLSFFHFRAPLRDTN
jgi:hypothetical protein